MQYTPGLIKRIVGFLFNSFSAVIFVHFIKRILRAILSNSLDLKATDGCYLKQLPFIFIVHVNNEAGIN